MANSSPMVPRVKLAIKLVKGHPELAYLELEEHRELVSNLVKNFQN